MSVTILFIKKTGKEQKCYESNAKFASYKNVNINIQLNFTGYQVAVLFLLQTS